MCTASRNPPLTEDFFKGNLSVSDKPVLNQPIDLIFTFSSRFIKEVNATNTTIKLFIPSGIEVQDKTEWFNINVDEINKVKTKIKVTEVGEREIRAYIETIFPKKEGFTQHKEYISYYLCLKTTETSGETSNSCPTKPGLEEKPIKE